MMETLYASQNLFHFVGHSDLADNLDCAPPAEEFSARFERPAIRDFGLLNPDLVFLGNRPLETSGGWMDRTSH